MKRPLLTNVLSSFVDKAFSAAAQFAAMVLTVRLLPRGDYGIVGIVAGCGALVQLLNISLDNAILREHRAHESDPERFLLQFLFFNLVKAVPILILALVLGFAMSLQYVRSGFFWATASMTVILLTESFVAPLAVYASARYQQRLVTHINMLRYSLNLAMLLGLLYWPTLSYLLVKDLLVMGALALVWGLAAGKVLGLRFRHRLHRNAVSLPLIRRTLTQYSIWVHLASVCTAFIYRADALFLSWFAPLGVVGNYNVALSAANVANVAPGILGYQNSVALSHAGEAREALRLTALFLRLSLYIGIATMLAFTLLGMPFLRLVTGEGQVADIYFYLICIALSLVLAKTVVSPLTAFVNVRGDVRRLFWRVTLPVALIAALSYLFMARSFGAAGVAVANIGNALIWVALLWTEARRYDCRFPPIASFSDDMRALRAWSGR